MQLTEKLDKKDKQLHDDLDKKDKRLHGELKENNAKIFDLFSSITSRLESFETLLAQKSTSSFEEVQLNNVAESSLENLNASDEKPMKPTVNRLKNRKRFRKIRPKALIRKVFLINQPC